jgi:hypothetical protein
MNANGANAKRVTLDDALADLRRPFMPAVIRAKPLTQPASDSKSTSAFYLDSRMVVARLDHVVGPGAWSDAYTLLCDAQDAPRLGFPVECRLTVLGVTKADVGQIAPREKPDDKAWKSAYSDALKRAAVKFQVGAFLYALPRLRAEVRIYKGKAQGFTPDGQADLMRRYTAWLESPANVYGDPLDHGDIGLSDDEHDREPEELDRQETAGDPTRDFTPRGWNELMPLWERFDPSHPWNEWIVEASRALYKSPPKQLEPAARQVLFQKCCTAYFNLDEAMGGNDFPPPTRAQVQAAFAPVVGGVVLEGPRVRMSPDETDLPLAEPVSGPDDKWHDSGETGGVE